MQERHLSVWGGSQAGKIKLIFIILVLVLVGGGAAGVMLMKKRAAATETEEAGEEEQKPAQIVELGEFLVNLTCADRLRYLKVEVALSVRGEGLEGGGGGHGGDAKPQLPHGDTIKAKDVAVEQLSAQEFATLRTAQGRQKLKDNLKKALEEALPKYSIEEVLLLSFVMQ